jgi:hypothetical protein
MTTPIAGAEPSPTSGPSAIGVTKKPVGLVAVAASLAASMLMIFGTGVASADDPHDRWDGKTYGEAAAAVSKYATPVVVSKMGGQVETDACIVIASTRSHYTDGRGRKRSRDYLFHLNCQSGVADGKPGNSVTSVIGQKTKTDESNARSLQARLVKNPDTCNKSENSYNWCVRLCDRTKLCEVPAYSGT